MKRAIDAYEKERSVYWNKKTDSKYRELLETRDYFKAQYDASISDINETCERIKELRNKFGVA